MLQVVCCILHPVVNGICSFQRSRLRGSVEMKKSHVGPSYAVPTPMPHPYISIGLLDMFIISNPRNKDLTFSKVDQSYHNNDRPRTNFVEPETARIIIKPHT